MKKKDHKPKFVEIRNSDATSFALFQNEVVSAMATHVFENDLFGDPNKNYSIFDDIISNAKHKHLQPKTVRTQTIALDDKRHSSFNKIER